MTATVVSHFERRSINQGTAKQIRQSGFYAEMTNSGNALVLHETGSITEGQLWQRLAEGSALIDPEDLIAVFESSMYDFDLCEDGSWRAWQDGHVVASGAFSRRDLSNLAEEALRLEQSRIGIHDNDRTGEQ